MFSRKIEKIFFKGSFDMIVDAFSHPECDLVSCREELR